MIREKILSWSLWLAVILMAIWIGGTIYQMLVIVPLWTASLPKSLRSFMLGTDFSQTVLRFFGPPFMVAKLIPIAVALAAGWQSPRHRAALLVALSTFVFVVAFTLLYIYPINVTIVAGGASSVEETRLALDRFILADRFRFAVGCVSFVALLWAFRLPSPRAREIQSRSMPPSSGSSALY